MVEGVKGLEIRGRVVGRGGTPNHNILLATLFSGKWLIFVLYPKKVPGSSATPRRRCPCTAMDLS